jgi:hypothetical protein
LIVKGFLKIFPDWLSIFYLWVSRLDCYRNVIGPDHWLAYFWLPGAGCPVLDILGAGCRLPVAGCWMLDPGCRILDA